MTSYQAAQELTADGYTSHLVLLGGVDWNDVTKDVRVVRTLTDERFWERNTEYLMNRFAGEESFALLTRVQVVNGVVLTPDLTKEESRLYEWPPPRP